jgi:hypothetical protein
MERNELVLYADGANDHLDLALRPGRPLGWATLDTGGTLAGTLGELGAERLGRRYPVLFDDGDRQELTESLARRAHGSPYFDPALILLDAFAPAGLPVPGFVALVSSAQLSVLPPCRSPEGVVLGNARLIRTVRPADPAPGTLEYQGAEYLTEHAPGPRDGELLLRTTPSSPFADLTGNRHSYFCVLNPVHAPHFTTDYLYVRNPFLAADHPGLETAIPVRVVFDDRVPAARVVLDSTTLFAIGLPQGEPAVLGPCHGRAGRVRNTLFGHRHAVARVGRTAVIDIEKPVTRLPEEMLDLLGISQGDRVIVEAAAHRAGHIEIARTTLRALPWREQSPLLLARSRTGVPDHQLLVGDEDFPMISLDLNARTTLGIVPGSAVYVRPALSSLLGREFTSVSFVLIAAIFSAAALQSLALAVVSASIYLVLTVFLVGARLR